MNYTVQLSALAVGLLAAGCGGTSRVASETLVVGRVATSSTAPMSPATRARTSLATAAPRPMTGAAPTGSTRINSAPAGFAPTTPAPTTPQPCRSSHLTVAQTGSQGTAGSHHADFTVSHPGPGQCSLSGWPSLTPYDRAGKAIEVTRTRTGTAVRLTVSADEPAGFSVRVPIVGCDREPVATSHMDVALPSNTARRVTVTDLPACPSGVLELTALKR